MDDLLDAALDQYRKEMQRWVEQTRHLIRANYGTAMTGRDMRHAEAFGAATKAVSVLFGTPLAVALQDATDPFEDRIDGLVSEVGALSTQLMMWKDFGRWLARRADARESLMTDKLTEAEQNLAHLCDEVETAIGDGSTKAAIVGRLREVLTTTDPEPF